MISNTLKKYIKLDAVLAHTRYLNNGKESKEEDAILEAMDDLWYELSEDEINKIRVSGAKNLKE